MSNNIYKIFFSSGIKLQINKGENRYVFQSSTVMLDSTVNFFFFSYSPYFLYFSYRKINIWCPNLPRLLDWQNSLVSVSFSQQLINCQLIHVIPYTWLSQMNLSGAMMSDFEKDLRKIVFSLTLAPPQN